MWQCEWRHLVAKTETDAMSPLGGQTCNLFKKHRLSIKSTTNASGAIWWPHLQPIQVPHLLAKIGTNASDATFETNQVVVH